MYGVILAAALTTAGSEPGCHFKCCAPSYCCAPVACYGCGGCYGCYGSCFGCGGCYGGCYGGLCFGCVGYYGGIYPSYAVTTPVMPPAMSPPAEAAPKPREDKPTAGSTARLTIEVPTGAKLFIDDQLMKGTATKRKFYTPKLEPGQRYYYMVRVEMERDGRTVSEEKKVVLTGGDQIAAEFRPTVDPLNGPTLLTSIHRDGGLGR
jgi:uncharacterized protein (TIGR03000 family)